MSLTADVRDEIRREVGEQIDARMTDVNDTLQALTESNEAIENALAAIGLALKALQKSNTVLAGGLIQPPIFRASPARPTGAATADDANTGSTAARGDVSAYRGPPESGSTLEAVGRRVPTASVACGASPRGQV